MLHFPSYCRNPWAGVGYISRNGILSGDRKEGGKEKGERSTKKSTT